jgi:tRNA-dihydrouridine synthase B
MRIGSLTIPTPLFLSPLAGYTNLPFRLVVREVGGVGLCTTDLVNARSLLEQREKAFKLIETNAADTPLAVQLFGSVPEEMRDAARHCLKRAGVFGGHQHGLSRAQGRQGRRRFGDDDGIG